MATHIDQKLNNPWGIISYNYRLWVVNHGNDLITSYDFFGNKLEENICIRDTEHKSSFPTGIVINTGSNFSTTYNNRTKAGSFVTATELGTVNVYNPFVHKEIAPVVLNMQLTGEVSIYRGLTIANNTLYLANFSKGCINVFDGLYNRLSDFIFVDNDLSDPIPHDYVPNNIVHIGCYLYVLFAKKDINMSIHDMPGPGHGFISVYNLDGSFVKRFASRGVLNSPWAMIPAPCGCGFPAESFIVGNNGDGRINVFDCNGRYVGPILNSDCLPVVIKGLRGLTFQDNGIYFTATNNNNSFVGSLKMDTLNYNTLNYNKYTNSKENNDYCIIN
jgi:uncharacterized protein (TIGR03118 family)